MLEGIYTGLRGIEADDLPKLLKWRNRPEFRRFFREHRELTSEQQSAWYEDIVLKDQSVKMFAIVALDDGRLLGACGLCYVDWINRSADFSIYIGDRDLYIDETLAPDAAWTLLAYGFGELNLHRVWAEIYTIDEAKQAFFQGLGFLLDGRHRETYWSDGAWHDSLFYGLLRQDYLAKAEDVARDGAI